MKDLSFLRIERPDFSNPDPDEVPSLVERLGMAIAFAIHQRIID